MLASAFAYTQGYQATQADIQMTVDRLDPSLLLAVQAVPNVKAAQAVSTLSVCWQQVATGCDVSMDILSAPDLRQLAITPLQLTAERYPGAGEIVLEQGDSSLHSVNIDDVVTEHLGDHTAQVRVVGLARTPSVDPHASGDALGYMSEEGLGRLDAALGNPMVTRPDGQQVPLYQHHIQVAFANTSAQARSAADRGGAVERADRGATGHQRADGEEPREQHSEQGAGGGPDAGGDLRVARGIRGAVVAGSVSGSRSPGGRTRG